MKNNKKRLIQLVIALVLTLSVGTSVFALTGNGGWITDSFLSGGDSNVKYEKPSIGDIAQDGAYPEAEKSESSILAQPKEWYEYIIYSNSPVETIALSNRKRVKVYDPYDYSYGLVMEISDIVNNPNLTFGKDYSQLGWSSADSYDFSYTTAGSYTWSNEISIDLGFEEEIKFFDTFSMKMSQTIGVSTSESFSISGSQTVGVSYNAVYFNEEGAPLQWTVVGYTVYLPIFVEVEELVNGEWVKSDEAYCVMKTLEGHCRAFIRNGTAYCEHWATGEPVTWDNFWDQFFTKESIVEAWQNKLIPNN